jgi:soluble lytic murein transglycosylase-like protein
MQLMPATASILGVRNSFDPGENIDGGARHLRGLIERFANDVPLALAAYNAGENAVVTYRGIPPYAETQDYVTRVLRLFYGTTTNGTPLPTETFKKLESDGTVVYTNIPPRPRL